MAWSILCFSSFAKQDRARMQTGESWSVSDGKILVVLEIQWRWRHRMHALLSIKRCDYSICTFHRKINIIQLAHSESIVMSFSGTQGERATYTRGPARRRSTNNLWLLISSLKASDIDKCTPLFSQFELRAAQLRKNCQFWPNYGGIFVQKNSQQNRIPKKKLCGD